MKYNRKVREKITAMTLISALEQKPGGKQFSTDSIQNPMWTQPISGRRDARWQTSLMKLFLNTGDRQRSPYQTFFNSFNEAHRRYQIKIIVKVERDKPV